MLHGEYGITVKEFADMHLALAELVEAGLVEQREIDTSEGSKTCYRMAGELEWIQSVRQSRFGDTGGVCWRDFSRPGGDG